MPPSTNAASGMDFTILRVSELPPQWQGQPSEPQMRAAAAKLGIPFEEIRYTVAFSTPECDEAYHYQRFLSSRRHDPTDQPVGICMHNAQTWVAEHGEVGVRAMQTSFARRGRPCHFVAIFGRRPASSAGDTPPCQGSSRGVR